MQFIVTPGGDEIAIMKADEALIMEGALSLYVMKNPNSNIAIRILREVSSANESREARMEAEAERACA
ncbi:hypothetical protein HEK616_10220 [Streptomyces nigrescens]|uniref:Uncharacterized protein n=1 Tax=Streptomyces nigrescens TaxID=1920 RepID=A0ABM7ZMJ3_STRNI|nr:hypothetical protein [Streptomyces nigrescens]BDM67535.1 hypothetical protein HEK616_10220 [Streptomyces nigrescens]